MLKKSFVSSPFKNPKCKEQEKFNVEAQLLIRENLNICRDAAIGSFSPDC